jgi:acetoin utilization protein AcuB
MRIQEVMTTDVVRAEPGEPAEGALRRMRARRIRHLVVMEGSRVVGIVSDRDLGGVRGGGGLGGRTVGDLMTRGVATVEPEDTVRRAANLLRGRIVGCLPVLSGNKLAGIVTTSDLLDLIGRGAERPVASATRRDLSRRGPRPPRSGPRMR